MQLSEEGRREFWFRSADVVIALILLIATFPLLLVGTAVVKMQDGGPILFAHQRIGRNGKPFGCLKFRTMVVDAEAQLQILLETSAAARDEWRQTHKLRNDPRITRFGHFLRRSSLDELPQLLNVLKGDMSLVGPRPIVEAEVSRYGPLFSLYCSVRPGVTGLWQISGRSNVSYAERVLIDVQYVSKRSMPLYLKVLIATVPIVLFQHGSY